MEPDLVAGAIAVALLFVSLGFWWRASRGRAAGKVKAVALGKQLTATRAEAARLADGEREGAWAARAAEARLAEALDALTASSEQIDRLSGDVDGLRDRLAAADRDIVMARAEADQAATRLAVLESETEHHRLQIEAARQAAAEVEEAQRRLSSVIRERDRLSATAQRVEHLEAELAALGRIHQDLVVAKSTAAELKTQLAVAEHGLEEERSTVTRLERDAARLRQELAEDRSDADRKIAVAAAEVRSVEERINAMEGQLAELSPVSDRLVAAEAMRREVEDQLAALAAARNAEQRRAADRISTLEHLHVDVGERDDRIAELEREVKELAEIRDDTVAGAGQLEVETTRLRVALAKAEEEMALLAGLREQLAESEARIGTLEVELAKRRPSEAEVVRLRKSLEAEKTRSQRLAQRVVAEKVPTTYADWDRTLRERVARAIEEATTRLHAEVDHLRAVVSEKERALAALSAASPAPVEITAIRGIGPVIAGILADHGVVTVADIAALSDDDIDRLGAFMPVYPGRIRRDDWVGQAAALLG